MALPDNPEHDGDHRELLDLLRLAMTPGVGPRTRQLLLERFGSPAGILAAAPSELRQVEGVGPKLAKAIATADQEIDAAGTLADCWSRGIQLLVDTDERYPRLLSEIADPPALLFERGRLTSEDNLAIAIVGTRRASLYGKEQARRLGASLARAGLTIVSGLARGIDAEAHRGALSVGGRTIAVLGGGVVEIYPPEHVELAQQVAEQGALLSENPPGTSPRRGIFPQRNRLIAGMSVGVIVVEAPPRSGALITAAQANEQGREVFAVPGPVNSPGSQGCHRLIRDGARLVESADDVLEELGPLVDPVSTGEREIRHPAELKLNEQEQQVLAAVGNEPISIDKVAAECGLPIHRVLATISVLEMRRMIARVSGNLVVRK